MIDKAELIGKRWNYSAKGYDEIIQGEFQGDLPELWSKQLREHAPCECGKVLDVGTGPGFFSILLSRMGWEVTGIDCSEAMVETAKTNAVAAGMEAEFLQMDNHELEFPDNTFDYIVSRNVTWIMYEPEKAFREWLRVLKPGGRILYFDANWPYRRDEEFVRLQKQDHDKYIETYGVVPPHTYTGDEETEKQVRQLLFFDKHWRPDWDEENLPALGYENVQIVPRVNEEVYNERKQLLYRSVPMFLVTADKPAF